MFLETRPDLGRSNFSPRNPETVNGITQNDNGSALLPKKVQVAPVAEQDAFAKRRIVPTRGLRYLFQPE
jgi:hypothetical protein